MAVVAAGAIATSLTGCSGATRPSTAEVRTARALDLATPMATSARTTAGTWAVIPMGRLDQPINTFWQLLYLPNDATQWSNEVEATATATNGGLLLAASGASLTVGVRPSTLLRFTPLITTTDGGAHWSNGLIDGTVEARPAALAADGATSVALTDASSGAEVITSRQPSSSWGTLVTQGTLAASPSARACGLAALTAVGYAGAEPLVGGSCTKPGTVALFAAGAAGWDVEPVDLPAGMGRDRTEVLALERSGGETSALVAASDGAHTQLLVVRSGGPRRWTTSDATAVPPGDQVTSVAPGPSGSTEVLLRAPDGHLALESADASGRWSSPTAPPAGTATVAATASGSLDALAGSGDDLTVWSLAPGHGSWARQQTMRVPIAYGSSS